MTIRLTNPETGDRHEIDGDAKLELQAAYDHAVEAERTELVFRGMRLDVNTAETILKAEGE